jgi:hypothetical protein
LPQHGDDRFEAGAHRGQRRRVQPAALGLQRIDELPAARNRSSPIRLVRNSARASLSQTNAAISRASMASVLALMPRLLRKATTSLGWTRTKGISRSRAAAIRVRS